jgi:hypothetical protein
MIRNLGTVTAETFGTNTPMDEDGGLEKSPSR